MDGNLKSNIRKISKCLIEILVNIKLVHLVECVGDGYYNRDMRGVRVDLAVLGKLLRERDLQLSQHFTEIELTMSMFARYFFFFKKEM